MFITPCLHTYFKDVGIIRKFFHIVKLKCSFISYRSKMLQDELYSSYKRYKADTDFVVTWLVSNAALCGFPVVDSTRATTASTSGQLKGKARQQARTAKTAQNSPTVRRSYAYRIDMKNLVPMAECISKSTKPRVEVSGAFAYVLQEAIKERKRHRAWHSSQSATDQTAEKDSSHEHFVSVLEAVWDILRHKFPPDIRLEDARSKSASNPHEAFANMFGNLEIMDTLGLSIEDEARSEIYTTESTKYTTNLSADWREPFFAALCLFRDFHRIRTLISQVWKGYKGGLIDLVPASITTNTAIDFIRSIQEAFELSFSEEIDLNKYKCIYCFYLSDTAAMGSGVHHKYEPCLESARATFAALLKAIEEDPSDFLPMVAPQLIELYEASIDRKSMTASQRRFQDYKLAMSVIPEFCL